MAISFDATNTGIQASGTSLTYSHTCSGSDRYLIVSTFTNSNTDQITGVTYNGVSMTRITPFVGTGGTGGISLYGLHAPATGANNVVITANTTTYIRGQSTSYAGVLQSTTPDSNNSGTTTANTVATASTTVSASNSWLISTSASSAGSYTSVSATSRQITGEPMGLQDSNTTVGTGSQSQTFTSGSSGNHIWAMVSLRPAGTIAFDSSAQAQSSSGATSLTYSHTCGSGAYLTVGVADNNNTVTGVTYNGVAMTLLKTQFFYYGTLGIKTYGLSSPATGANNVVVTKGTGSGVIDSCSHSVLLASLTQPDATGGANNPGPTGVTSLLTSITTVANNCWTVLYGWDDNGGTLSASTGSTLRSQTGNGFGVFDSNGDISPAGSYSMTFTGINAHYVSTIVSIAPMTGSSETFVGVSVPAVRFTKRISVNSY